MLEKLILTTYLFISVLRFFNFFRVFIKMTMSMILALQSIYKFFIVFDTRLTEDNIGEVKDQVVT